MKKYDPYGVAHLIAYFGYEQVYCHDGSDSCAPGYVPGEKSNRSYVRGFENHLAHLAGVCPDNKCGFLWVDTSGVYHYAMFYDFNFTTIEWYAYNRFANDLPSNFGERRGRDLVLAAYRTHRASPSNYPIQVKQYVSTPRDFRRLAERLLQTPIGTVWILLGDDKSLWKLTNAEDGLQTSRIVP